MSFEPTKTCPYCAETINANAVKCRYCGSVLAPMPHHAAPPQYQSYSMPPVRQPAAPPNVGYIPRPEQLLYPPSNYGPEKFTTPYALAILGGYIGSLLFIIGAFTAASTINDAQIAFGGLLVLVGMLLSFVGGINVFIVLYRCWRVIQDGYAQTTPGKAVGLLFIPLFNIYWAFIAFYGLSNDLNRYIYRNKLVIKPCNSGLVLCNTIFSIIPYLNFLICTFLAPFSLYTLMRTARDIQQAKFMR